MKRYGLFTKNSDEAINNIPSRSLEEAKSYFMSKKQLKQEMDNALETSDFERAKEISKYLNESLESVTVIRWSYRTNSLKTEKFTKSKIEYKV